MNCEFFNHGKFMADCNQADMPQKGDYIIIESTRYLVLNVVWNYDTRDIRINVGGA